MKTKQEQYNITVLCDAKNLELIRDFVIKIAKRTGLNSEKIHQIEMAVDEAATNVMKHALKYNSSKKVSVRVKVRGNDFIIEIVDRSDTTFDPQSVEKVDLQEFVAAKKRGGLGIHLINNLMDNVEYYSGANNYNRVKLVKKID